MRREDVESICVVYFGNEKLEAYLRKLNFIMRNESRNVFLYINTKNKDSELYQTTMMDEKSWHLLEGDLDL